MGIGALRRHRHQEPGDEEQEEVAAKPEVDATDAAREVAEEHGLDLAEIEGTGTGGRVLKSDAVAAAEED